MKTSFLLFAITDLFLLATTAVTGLMVMGVEGYGRHFLLGIMAAMFTCFVHIVLFMYFVVQQKIMAQAIMAGDISEAFAERVQRYKTKAVRLSVAGIAVTILTSSLGATIEVGVPPEAHLLAAFSTIFINAFLFFFQFSLLDGYAGLFTEAFQE